MESSVDEALDPAENAEIAFVKQQFEEYMDSTLGCRAVAEKCRAYRDGDQLTEDERRTLKKRNQPAVIDNKIQDKCDTLLGLEKQFRTDPKAFPRTQKEEGAADAATDALRFIADQSDFNRSVRKPAADNLMVEGLCAGQVVVDPVKRNGMVKVSMEHIRWDRTFYDIHSLREDFADARYAGFFTWMDIEQAKEQFDPKKNKNASKTALEALEAAQDRGESKGDSSLDDKPRFIMTSRGRKRVQVFEHYFIENGVWMLGKWCAGGWLEDKRKSPWLNEHKEPVCGIEIQALYRKGDDASPYGAVQRYLDPQDMHNKRHSKMMHLLNTRRIVAPKGAFPDGVQAARDQVHRPDGVLEHIPGMGAEVRVEDNLREADSQFSLLQYTDQLLSQVGPNAALAGQSGDISGRAKQLDQNAGSLPISPLFEALDAWELRMFRQAWMRVRQFWNEEIWIRVTDDEDNLKYVGLNQRMLVGDAEAEKLKDAPIPPEQKMALIQQMAQNPEMQQPLLVDGKPKIKNNVAEMDVDIIIDRTMDTVNVQQEQFTQLVDLAKARPEVKFKTLLELSQLRSDVKRRVMDDITGADDPMAAQMAAMQQRLAELEMGLKEAQLAREQAATAKDVAAAKESQVDAAVKVAEFITNQAQPKTAVTVN